jgi:hypothetical protein
MVGAWCCAWPAHSSPPPGAGGRRHVWRPPGRSRPQRGCRPGPAASSGPSSWSGRGPARSGGGWDGARGPHLQSVPEAVREGGHEGGAGRLPLQLGEVGEVWPWVGPSQPVPLPPSPPPAHGNWPAARPLPGPGRCPAAALTQAGGSRRPRASPGAQVAIRRHGLLLGLEAGGLLASGSVASPGHLVVGGLQLQPGDRRLRCLGSGGRGGPGGILHDHPLRKTHPPRPRPPTGRSPPVRPPPPPPPRKCQKCCISCRRRLHQRSSSSWAGRRSPGRRPPGARRPAPTQHPT